MMGFHPYHEGPAPDPTLSERKFCTSGMASTRSPPARGCLAQYALCVRGRSRRGIPRATVYDTVAVLCRLAIGRAVVSGRPGGCVEEAGEFGRLGVHGPMTGVDVDEVEVR